MKAFTEKCPDCTDGFKPNTPYTAKISKLDWRHFCSTCNGTGQIPTWPTVEKFEKVNVYKLKRNDAVWERSAFPHSWNLKLLRNVISNNNLVVVAIPGLGKPDDDWRPKDE